MRLLLVKIFNALEGPLDIVECIDNPTACDKVSICVTRDVWMKLKNVIDLTLDSITLEDLVKMYEKKESSIIMYTI